MSDTLRIVIRKFEGFEAAIEHQWRDFVESTKTNATLHVRSLDLLPLEDVLFTSDGLRSGDVDMAFICTDWLADAVAQDMLLDLSPLMKQRPVQDYPEGWSPAMLRLQTFNNAVFGLPYHDGPECLIYRADLFDDPGNQREFMAHYGEPLAPPKTWEAFESVARFFTNVDQGEFGTIFAAYPDGHNTVYDFCLQVWSRGGELHNELGIPTLATAEAVVGLDFYRRLMADRTVTPPGLELVDSVESGRLFARGDIAMMVNWFGCAAECEQPESPVRGKVGVAPVPSNPGILSPSLNVYWVLAIGSGSRHAELAYAFIRHCAAPAMDKITAHYGNIGCRLSTWHDTEINAEIPFYRELEVLHRHARELPRSRHLPDLIRIIDQAVLQALTTTESSDSILAHAQLRAEYLRL